MSQTLTAAGAILESLRRRFAGQPGPLVNELIKPPGGAAERVSRFTLLLLDSGAAGLCFNLLDDANQAADYDRLDPEAYRGQPALELAADLLAPGRAPRIVGYAAANALSQELFRRDDLPLLLDTDLLDALQIGAADHVGLVGYAPPLGRELLARAGRLTVLDSGPRELPEGMQGATSPADLAPCHKLLVTSTTLLNDTFDPIAEATAGAAARALYGPGAGLLPEALFARGFTAVAGTLVTDPEALAERQQTGKRWGDAKRKFVLTRPG